MVQIPPPPLTPFAKMWAWIMRVPVPSPPPNSNWPSSPKNLIDQSPINSNSTSHFSSCRQSSPKTLTTTNFTFSPPWASIHASAVVLNVLSASSLSRSTTSLVQAATHQTAISFVLLYLYMMMLATWCQQDYLMTYQPRSSESILDATDRKAHIYLTLMLLEQGHLMGNKVSMPHLLSHDQVMLLLPMIFLRQMGTRGLFLITLGK
jgi:hypothetical protein